jgi:hypothetical protein
MGRRPLSLGCSLSRTTSAASNNERVRLDDAEHERVIDVERIDRPPELNVRRTNNPLALLTICLRRRRPWLA